MPSKKHESSIIVSNTNIPNGTHKFVVTDWETNSLYESSIQTVVNGETEFLIDAPRGQRCMVGVSPNTFPPENTAYFGSIADGTLEMFANESLKVGDGFAPTGIVKIGENELNSSNTFNVSGVAVSISEGRSLHIGLNGIYDYLDVGQTATLQIPYTKSGATLGDNIWLDAWDDSLTGYDPTFNSRWVDQGQGWYSLNYSEFPEERIALVDVDAGDIYEFTMEIRVSSLGGTLNGEVEFSFVDSNGDFIGQKYQKNMPDQAGQATHRFTVPANTVGFCARPGSGTRADIRITGLKPVVGAEVSFINVLVKGSQQVGPKLAQVTALAGNNWTKDGSEYTHTAGSVEPLSVSVSTSVGKIIQISCNTKSATAGSITIANATRDYSTVLNDGDVWLVRATNTSFTVEYTPTSDFDGVVYDTFIREVVTETYAANAYDLVSVDHVESGKATIEWKWPIIAPRNSLTETPDNYLTGVLAQSEEFAHRYDNEEQSAVYENATFSGTRSGISLRSGGSWVEVFNVVGVGGFTSQGVIGEPLITEDGFTISGSGFSYLGWGNYNADSDTNDIIRANLTGVEGGKLHITVLKRDTTSGTIIPRLIGDTTTTGSLINSDQLHDTYIITIPANMVRVEYVANGFQGRISRLIVSSLTSEFNDSPSDKFQSLFANANRPGPQIDDLRMYYFDFDLFIPPMPDNYGTTNSDGIVLNRGFDTSISYRGTAHMVGGDIKNVSDAGVDGKTDTFFNYGKIFGGHRGFRNHAEAHHVLTNSEVNRHGESQAALFFSTSSERTTVWNLYVDNVRSSSSLQLNNFMSVSPPVALDSPKGALSGDVQDDSVILQCNVLRTIPRVDPKAKVAMTHMEFEHKLSNSSTWVVLNLPLVDLPGFVGNRRRTFDLSPGTYDFRARCINGQYTGTWVTITNQVVN
jgi:hypothetical protein